MPRLSNYDYLLLHAHLHQLWENKRLSFGLITTKDQRYLHDFFRLSEMLTEAELLAHRKAITIERPSLPHQAGRALKHLAKPLLLKQPPGNGRIIVHPVVRPHPDVKRLARALQDLARRIAEEGK